MEKKYLYQVLGKYFDQYQISQLIEKQTGLSKSQLFLCSSLPYTDDKWLEKMIKFGENKYPFEYIINKSEFYNLEFYVDENVLIPRNDTEIMVDTCINFIEDYKEDLQYIDVGTGSSCIPISIIKKYSGENIKKVSVIDISKTALKVSYQNILEYNLENYITQYHGNLLKPILKDIETRNDIVITANLPYIKNADYDNMQEETIKYEPDIALYGGVNTGFELYEKLILQAIEIKKNKNIQNIILFIEIGFDQREYSQKYLQTLGILHEYYKDNNGVDRCIKIKL